MAVLALAAPPYRSLHLHERLQAELGRRGHHCVAWCDDPRAARFWQDQGFAAVPVRPGAADPLRVPVHELAADEATRRGLVAGSPAHRRVMDAVAQRLARLVPAALRLFEQQRPDLLLACGDRRAERRLLAFLARELGVRVLWFAPGLLPHTLQHDESGLDGDAAIVRRTAGDYRDVMLQTRLLDACLAHAVARDLPAALSRRPVRAPVGRRHWQAGWQAVRQLGLGDTWRTRDAWRQAIAPPREASAGPCAVLPPAPFAAVLLQAPDDERVHLDAPLPLRADELAAAALAAVRCLDPLATVAAVLPPGGLDLPTLSQLAAQPGVHVLPAPCAAEACLTALATFTINHPMAVCALLAGTPVLHTGQALYSLPGVTWRGPSMAFADQLPRQLTVETTTLRKRFLTALLSQDHLWCSLDLPDHNGVLALAAAIEDQLGQRSPRGARLPHRAGPPWPLAATGGS